MINKLSVRACIAVCTLGMAFSAFAGNKDRTGQAGAAELLINPWARSTGLFGLNTASVVGIEAMKSNIAGLGLDTSTEIGFSHGIYLTGTNVSINDIAIAQHISETSVIGFNIMSMGFGDIPATNYYAPEGYGSFQPQYLNIEMGFSKRFSTHVSVGFAATYVSEQISNVGAQGLAMDGGIQYVTGKRDNFHFGITLRNIGTNMRFTGTGFSVNMENPQSTPVINATTLYPSEKFEIPTYLNFGAAYDLYLDEHHITTSDSTPKHRLSIIGDFQSNSFNNDYMGIGFEYSFSNILMLRAAYRYENGIGNPATSTTMYVGLATGITVQKRFGSGPMFSFDYSYRPTDRPANGVHMLSLRLTR